MKRSGSSASRAFATTIQVRFRRDEAARRDRTRFGNGSGRAADDEPFASLDAQNRAILQAELANICEQTGTTVIYITHSLEEALMLGDRAVVLTAQPARIKDEVIVPFPRPRDTIEVSATPMFGELKLRMWNVLEAEVLQARREHEGV